MKDKTRIVKVKKNPNGDITDVMLENGNVYSVDEAEMMARDGLISGVNDLKEDNLKRLPAF